MKAIHFVTLDQVRVTAKENDKHRSQMSGRVARE